MTLHVISAPDSRQDGLHVRSDAKVWRGRNRPGAARKFGMIRVANKMMRRRAKGQARPRKEAAIELITHGQRLHIARGANEEMLRSLLIELQSDADARIEVVLPTGERVRIASGIDAAELSSLLEMRPL